MVVGTNDDINKIEATPADFETAISHTGKICIIILYFKFNNLHDITSVNITENIKVFNF